MTKAVIIGANDEPFYRVSQGDIYKDVEYIESVKEQDGDIEISKIIFPYVIVLTQDCDLAQDFSDRFAQNTSDELIQCNISDELIQGNSLIMSVLVAPLYNAEQVCSGEHLSELKRNMNPIVKYKKKGKEETTDYKRLLQNETPRYHYVTFRNELNMSSSVIDFKHYFSLNTDHLYSIKEQNFVCKISELYREHISQRFAYFLSRIGLPDNK
ncbi:hypothetical protein [Methanosarcina mazei]|uniref:Uncharacterized protein n=1 Tax=Methanosarcina mazei TaxID=2209 RepID=A0A0F8LR83_METMZ|nr:hypothetical protein [Methanosarcina mazei]KKG92433.1 hypothetical protein DU66_10575 [Methanosarcina mazei]KKG95449.1 hypothetical protein DU69_06315 [Methanosarcina mazei]KKG95820.1 hypothetical protein DU68_16315 [Methanosarcina mazei]KKH04017.1 hypothetical protein DU56_15970 [Methanosarcina mazei]